MPKSIRTRLLAFIATICTLFTAVAEELRVDTIPIGADSSMTTQLPLPSMLRYTSPHQRRISAETRIGFVFPSNRFVRGENLNGKPIDNAFSAHLKYTFGFPEESFIDNIYSGAYQGLGLAYYNFGEPEQLGTPLALYLFQGARIVKFSSAVSLNYEWNFGLSGGWKPYNSETNGMNHAIGSKFNAYMNVDFYLLWRLTNQIDVTSGFALTHFSNGNTKFPNAGLNLGGWSAGVSYRFDQRKTESRIKRLRPTHSLEFPRHVSYDLLLFGSWRRKGVYFDDGSAIASPHTYTVLGFNFAPMYNFNYRFRAGVSLDGVYDGSANVYVPPYISGTPPEFFSPDFDHQIALGLSGRAEYVMPYFSVGLGMGANVLHSGGDLKGFYQTLSLKIELTRSSFLNIGYNLKDFHEPNYLMLGIGYRFNNRYPFCHR